MAKIKLTKLLEESIEDAKKKEQIKREMDHYAQKIEKGIEKLKTLVRRDGYNV